MYPRAHSPDGINYRTLEGAMATPCAAIARFVQSRPLASRTLPRRTSRVDPRLRLPTGRGSQGSKGRDRDA